MALPLLRSGAEIVTLLFPPCHGNLMHGCAGMTAAEVYFHPNVRQAVDLQERRLDHETPKIGAFKIGFWRDAEQLAELLRWTPETGQIA